jgi:hypothetical protein
VRAIYNRHILTRGSDRRPTHGGGQGGYPSSYRSVSWVRVILNIVYSLVGVIEDPPMEAGKVDIPPATSQLAGQEHSLNAVYLLAGANDGLVIPSDTNQLVK